MSRWISNDHCGCRDSQRRMAQRAMGRLILWLVFLAAVSCPTLMAQDRPAWARDLPNLPTKAGWYQGLGMAKAAGKS